MRILHTLSRRCTFALLSSVASFLLISPVSSLGKELAAGFRDRVLKVQSGHLVTKFGTSWCADPGCSVLLTNYHVARAGMPTRVAGAKVDRVYLATGPDDRDAVWIATTYGRWMRFNPLRDVAVISLRRKLAPGMPAPDFYGGPLSPGEELLVYGYPGGNFKYISAKFVGVTDGMLELAFPDAVSAGLSGGMVVDGHGRIVGMMSLVAEGKAFAVPLWSIADAIRKARPELYTVLFPGGVPTPPELQDSMALSPEMRATLGGVNPEPVLPLASLNEGLGLPFERLPPKSQAWSSRKEPLEIRIVRQRAQQMFASMEEFTALQTLQLTTEGKPDLVWIHELYVAQGELVFRSLEDEQQLPAVAFPHRRRSVIPGAEWQELPRLIGTEAKLRLEEVGAREIGGKRVRVFRYQGRVEDGICRVRFRREQGLWSREREFAVGCHGEVWTNSDLSILRITRELEIADRVPMRLVQMAVLYGWVGHDLVPTEMSVRAEIAGHACSAEASFSNYKRIGSQ
jgi:hypothetical protein